MTTKINASTAGLTETVDTSGILEIQTANTAALIIDASQNANFVSTGAITVPVGTTAQRPTGVNGMIRYNSNTAAFEFYANNTWTGANVTPPAVISVAPVISGSAVVGQNLTSTTGTWTGTVTGYYYQWLANSTAISNATANVFTLTSTQNNTNITCNVTAYNIAGNSTPSTSNSLGPVTSTYLINNSLRFRASASAYLSRTNGVSGNSSTWTYSVWVKRGLFTASTAFPLLTSYVGTSNYSVIDFYNDKIRVINNNSGAGEQGYTSTPVYRDPAAWYHIVVSSSASAIPSLYVNGVQITAYTASGSGATVTTPWYFGSTTQNRIGYEQYSTINDYFDGYFAEARYIDGQALTPSSFGQTDSTTGAWIPTAYAGTYGTNGFYLPFSNTTSTTTLGYDSSGNGNNWTTNNISLTAGSTYDSMTDVPTLTSATTANYAVLNPLSNQGNGTISGANLNYVSSAAAWKSAAGTMFMSSGQWYYECTVTNFSSSLMVGICNTSLTNFNDYAGDSANSWSVQGNASGTNKWNNNSSTSIAPGEATSTGDIFMVAFDVAAAKVWFGKNGTWYSSGNPAAGTNAAFTNLTGSIGAMISSVDTSCTLAVNFGQRPFSYTPPSGFVAMNTYNI